MSKKGLFIVFEGGEGSGKTTLIDSVAAALAARGVPFLSLREPGGTTLGEAIRRLLLEKNDALHIGSKAELCLFLAARCQNISENIEPALAAGKVVLCDRFNASTIAYQGHARALGEAAVSNFCSFVSQDVAPDLTIFLDIDPRIGLQRSQKLDKEHASAGATDRIESETMDFHEAVREGFRRLAAEMKDSSMTIDASNSKEAVFEEVWKQITPYLQPR